MKTSLPHVVITSHLPRDKEKRKIRLDYHKRQLQDLYSRTPTEYTITTLASGWSSKEARDFPYKIQDADDWPSKWEKHNWVFERLYNSKVLDTVLLLDDDVVPRTPKPEEVGAGLCDALGLAYHMSVCPDQMLGQCVFFASAGLRFDAFWKANQPVVKAPPQVVGWAMMVRSDLGVVYDKELVTDPGTGLVSTDYPFRTKCLAEGKTVVKHNRAFWKTFQSLTNTEKTSTWVGSHEERLEGRKLHENRMRRMFPAAFQKPAAAKTGSRPGGRGFAV